MNRVTLIQLRGNIPYTLFGTSGIDSKYNSTIVSISTKLDRAPFYLMKCLEALQSISQIPKESEAEGQYRIMLFILSETIFDSSYQGFLAFFEESAVSLMTYITCHSSDHRRCPWNDFYHHQVMCPYHSNTPSHNGQTYYKQGICFSFHP